MNFSYCALFNSNYLSAALCFNVTFIDNNLNPNITFTLLLLRLSQFYFMRKLIDNKSQTLSQQQSPFLPHLKSKSMSINSKLPINSNRRLRYQDLPNNYKSTQKKCIINLEQIQRNSKVFSSLKINLSQQKKKIISQYQTIDLWKQKHNIVIHIKRKKQKGQKSQKQQPEPAQLMKNSNILQQCNREQEQKNILKRQNKLSLSKLRPKNRSQVSRQIPEEVLVSKIDEYRVLKNDDKLELALRKQLKNQKTHSIILKKHRQSIPIFQRQSLTPLMNRQLQPQFNQIENPTKWDATNQFTDQQDHIF